MLSDRQLGSAIKQTVSSRLGCRSALSTVAIIGVGLIGGSVGLALRERGLAAEIVGIGRDRTLLEEIRRQGVIHRGTTALEEGVANAQIVVVCTPVNRIADDVRRAALAAGPGVLVTDAGSTKRQIVEAIERYASSAGVFVGASARRVGTPRSRSRQRRSFSRPHLHADADSSHAARAPAPSAGFLDVAGMPAGRDRAPPNTTRSWRSTSHLPHALAAALATSVPAEWQALAAGAFRDGTRVAGADTALWTAIFRDNRGPLLKALGHLQENLDTFKYALMTDDEDAIRRWWDDARRRRSSFDAEYRETEPDPKLQS